MTIDGMVEVKIPKGAQPDAVLMLRGRGLPRLTGTGASSGRGNQLVHIRIQIPTWVLLTVPWLLLYSCDCCCCCVVLAVRVSACRRQSLLTACRCMSLYSSCR